MKAHVEAATAPKTADPPASPALGRFDLDKDGFPVHPIMGGSGTHTFRGAGHARTWAVGLDMPEFAKLLSNQLSLPVTDATGLAGKYDSRQVARRACHRLTEFPITSRNPLRAINRHNLDRTEN